jgi:hypothetical protein
MVEMQLAPFEAGHEMPTAAHRDERLAFPQAAALIVIMSIGCWSAIAGGCVLLLP